MFRPLSLENKGKNWTERVKKQNLFFRFIFQGCRTCLFVPRPNYDFFSLFGPEMFQNLLFSGSKPTFSCFPKGGLKYFFIPKVGLCCPEGG